MSHVWMASVPGRHALEIDACANEHRLAELSGDELQANRQSCLRDPAGNVIVGLPVMSNGEV